MTEPISTLIPPVPEPAAPTDTAELIKPIETRYAGCRFRSRLEARWAVFFDHLSIEWQYEPECFKVAGKGYLPDFFLPGLDVWAEVKGVLDQPTLSHLTSATDPQSGLPANPLGRPWQETHRTGRILLLGSVPKAGAGWTHTRLDFSHGQPLVRTFAFHALESGGATDQAIATVNHY